MLNDTKILKIPTNPRVLVFGGALGSNCYRHKLLEHLSTNKALLTIIPDKINYFDISSANYNLLEKETRLFENSDILIIIPESAGSFAEIGMIASMISNHTKKIDKNNHAKKVLIISDIKYKHDESFLKLGPIKIIKEFGGKLINIDFNSSDFSKVTKQFNRPKSSKLIRIDASYDNKTELFFINCIKILLYIYRNKSLLYAEYEYKNLFVQNLKAIHISISIDNIEYLESTELISKTTKEGDVTIAVNHIHPFMDDLINLNFGFFKKNKIIHSFLMHSGY